MANGYCIEWSAWRVWLHPHKALDAINNAEVIESDYERRLEESLALIEEQKKECARLTNEVGELSRRCVGSENSLADTRRQLNDALREVDELRSVDQRLNEFDKMLEKVEDMKRNYERRIRTLESRLRDEKKRAQRDDSSDLIETIDMRASGTLAKENLSHGFGMTSPRRINSKPIDSTPRKILNHDSLDDKRGIKAQDSDDWLLELPNDL